MAGSARLSSRNAASIGPPRSAANGQLRQGFGYQEMAPVSNFPTGDALLGAPRRPMDHRPSLQSLPFPLQQQQREMAMKRRISEEMERERERERALLLERGRADRLLMERAARISGGVGLSGGRMYEGEGSLPPLTAERLTMMFPERRTDGAGILGSNASFPGLDRRVEPMHMGSSLQMDMAIDRSFDKAQRMKGLEKVHTYDRRIKSEVGSPFSTETAVEMGFERAEASKSQEKPRGRDTLRIQGIGRNTEQAGAVNMPRGMEKSRKLENVRGAEMPRITDSFRSSDSFRVLDAPNARDLDQSRAINSRAMELAGGGNSTIMESPEHYSSLENAELSRGNLRASEIPRVTNKSSWGSKNSQRVLDSSLAESNAKGMERPIDLSSASNKAFEANLDGNNGRDGFKPTLRPSSHERKNARLQIHEDDNGKVNNEKQNERPVEDSSQEVVAQYKMGLAGLTFNSKPIITNLTIIAGENLHESKAIASAVCSHILEVPVEQKLPSLYLLDSIVKNISGSYVKHFAARLPEVFIRAYRQVDPALHPAMQHLFKTWRGVFEIEPLQEIERELQLNILGTGSFSVAPPSSSARSSSSPPPMQRPHHGIHVNPKYLEAQRLKSQQQSSQFSSRSRRDSGETDEIDTLHKSATSLPEFDYNTLADNSGINVGRKSGWEMGRLPIREEDTTSGMESGSFGYGLRNGNAIQQQQSPRALIDAYGNVRGVRASRLPSTFMEPADTQDIRDRGQTRDWQSTEEEEYRWEVANTRGEESRRSDNEWLHGSGNKSSLSGSMSVPKQQVSGRIGWRKHGDWSGLADQPISAEDSQIRVEERVPYWDLRPSVLDTKPEESSLIRLKGHSFGGQQPHPPMEPFSPPLPSQSGRISLQNDRIETLSAHAKVSEVSKSGLGSKNEGLVMPPSFYSHSPFVPISVNMHFEASSPVVRGPSSKSNQKGLPSQPLLTAASQLHPPFNSSHHSQHSSTSSQGHGFYPQPMQFEQSKGSDVEPPKNQAQSQSHASDMQAHSSQQPMSVSPWPRLPTPQLPLKPLGPQRPPLPGQQAVEQSPMQPPASLGPGPVLPQFPSSLLESLQQLQRHLPTMSEGAVKLIPPVQNPALSGSSQVTTERQSPELSSQNHPLHHQEQQLPLISAPLAHVPFNDAFTLPSGTQSNFSANNLLAAFLQSTSKSPNQGAQYISETLAAPSLPASEPAMPASVLMAGGPPLPSGPPPRLISVTGQAASSAPIALIPPSSSLLGLAPPVVQPVATPPKLMQPPLPPGPPPPPQQTSYISQVQPRSTRPPSTGANDLNSLLSSLMAHGVLAAPPSASIPAQTLEPPPNASKGILGTPIISEVPSSKRLTPTNVVPQTSSAMDAKGHEAPSEATKGKEAPFDFDCTEFKPEFLRERHESVIKALYSDFPRQCKTCGLRFKHQEEHSEHMDWHVSRNRRQKSTKKVSRKWFVNMKEWLSGLGAASSEVSPAFFAEVAEKVEEPEKVVAVPADEDQLTCALCGELFEDFYSDEIDEWMYKGAVYMNVPIGGSAEGLDKASLGPIVHANCRSESAGGAPGDLAEDAELFHAGKQG